MKPEIETSVKAFLGQKQAARELQDRKDDRYNTFVAIALSVITAVGAPLLSTRHNPLAEKISTPTPEISAQFINANHHANTDTFGERCEISLRDNKTNKPLRITYGYLVASEACDIVREFGRNSAWVVKPADPYDATRDFFVPETAKVEIGNPALSEKQRQILESGALKF